MAIITRNFIKRYCIVTKYLGKEDFEGKRMVRESGTKAIAVDIMLWIQSLNFAVQMQGSNIAV